MAPYAGHLVTPSLAIALAVQGSSCVDRINIELARQTAECKISIDVLTRLRDLEAARADALEAKLDHPAWYSHPIFVMALVAAIGAGTAVAISRL